MPAYDFGSGSIAQIIDNLEATHGVTSVWQLDTKVKLDALCFTLGFTATQLDKLIANNSPVLRTVQGHVFEVVFDYIVQQAGYNVQVVGGDTEVDRIVNGKTLQLKTPTAEGTSGNNVQYKTHKTHGAKSELESMDYYNTVDKFADYLVGLVSYNPLCILLLNKSELPTHLLDPTRIQSPFAMIWADHPGLNAFQRIGIKQIDLTAATNLVAHKGNELLPLTAARLNVASNIILNTILTKSNFRIWDMTIRGFAREIAFRLFLANQRIAAVVPSETHRSRADKSDVALPLRGGAGYRFIQVKGLSFNNCKFRGRDSLVASETQLTRGRINDHETQSRMYLTSDFDYVLVAIDPCFAAMYHREIGTRPTMRWEFYAIPTSELETHANYPHRIKPMQKFRYIAIQKYLVDAKWSDLWEKGQPQVPLFQAEET